MNIAQDSPYCQKRIILAATESTARVRALLSLWRRQATLPVGRPCQAVIWAHTRGVDPAAASTILFRQNWLR